MATIQSYPDELDYVNAKLKDCGGFLRAFFFACLKADSANYELLRQPLADLRRKYPVRHSPSPAEQDKEAQSGGFDGYGGEHA